MTTPCISLRFNTALSKHVQIMQILYTSPVETCTYRWCRSVKMICKVTCRVICKLICSARRVKDLQSQVPPPTDATRQHQRAIGRLDAHRWFNRPCRERSINTRNLWITLFSIMRCFGTHISTCLPKNIFVGHVLESSSPVSTTTAAAYMGFKYRKGYLIFWEWTSMIPYKPPTLPIIRPQGS